MHTSVFVLLLHFLALFQPGTAYRVKHDGMVYMAYLTQGSKKSPSMERQLSYHDAAKKCKSLGKDLHGMIGGLAEPRSLEVIDVIMKYAIRHEMDELGIDASITWLGLKDIIRNGQNSLNWVYESDGSAINEFKG